MAEDRIEEVGCPLCGSRESDTYLLVWDRFDPDRQRRWRIVRCRRCDLLFLNPRPTADELARYYVAEGYDPFSAASKDPSLWDRVYGFSRDFTLRWKRRLIERSVAVGRLLDVGCATGEFLHFMKEAGWQVAGLEPDARAAEFARQTLGLAVETGGVDRLAQKAGQWDAITFWHVLEHLHDPISALQSTGTLLAPGGLLVVALPNPDSLDARFYGHRWVAWDAPRHLVHFTRRTLARAAAEAGLEIVGQKSMPLDPAYNCLMSERYDTGALPVLKWARAAAVAAASWTAGLWPRDWNARGSSTTFLLRHKRREGKWHGTSESPLQQR